MELPLLLHHLHLSSSSSSSPQIPALALEPRPPVVELLVQLHQALGGAADLEAAGVIGRVEQMFKMADAHWLFSPDSTNQSDDASQRWEELEQAYVGLVEALTQHAALPLCEPESCSLPESSYRGVSARATPICAALTALLGRLGPWEGPRGGSAAWSWERPRGGGTTGPKEGPQGGCTNGPEEGAKGGNTTGPGAPVSLLEAVTPLCYVFAVTHIQVQPWSDAPCRQAAGSLLEALLAAGGWRDPAHLLMGEEEQEESGSRRDGAFGGVLDILQPQLTKERWQRSEAVKLVFCWTLLQVTRPRLHPHLPRLLPPSLLLADHHHPENCMLGIRCLHHLVLHTPAAELRQYNRGEVLYQALYKHLYTTQYSVLQLVTSCLLDLLPVLEKPPSTSPSLRKPCRHDDVLRLILTNMEVEHKVALRREYAAALHQYTQRMGVAVCRHLRRVERVVLSFLELSDAPEETSRISTLETLETLLRVAWPRMQSRVCVFLRALLRLLVDVSCDRALATSVRERLTDRTTRCLVLLQRLTHDRLQSAFQQVDSSCASDAVLSCLATVTTATES